MLAATVAVVATGLMALPAAAQEKLNIGISVKSIFGLPIVIADQEGFFKDEGLDVTIEYFAGGPPATAALMGGSLQFLNAAFENNVKTVKKNQPLVTIMSIQSDFAGAIIMRKEVAEKFGGKPKVSDLKGLRVGTLARGGFADVSARYMITDAGLEPEKDVVMIPIKGADRQLTAGEAGEIDAAMVTEPWSVIAVEGMDKWVYVVNLTVGEGPDVFHDMGYVTLQTTKDYLAENPETAKKVVRAIVKAQNFIADPANLDEVSAIADKEYGSPGVDVMKISVERQAKTYVPFMKPEMVTKTMDLLLPNGLIEEPAPAYEDLVDQSFAPLWDAYKK
jgi:NitT/TauT family transport system substrate-binding protein